MIFPKNNFSKNGFLCFSCWGKSGFSVSGVFLGASFDTEETGESLNLVFFASSRNLIGASTSAAPGLLYYCIQCHKQCQKLKIFYSFNEFGND